MLEDTKAALTKPKDFEQFSLPQCEHKNFRAGIFRWKTSATKLDRSRMPSSQTVTAKYRYMDTHWKRKDC